MTEPTKKDGGMNSEAPLPKGSWTGPAPRQRIRHRGSMIREDGPVSALCFKSPRPINMKLATWVYRDEAVTCPRCLEIINAR